MTYYPIIIPTLNRYSHFKRCVESLIACTHADKTELVIGLDYPPSEKYIDGWKKIKDYIPSITGFQKVTVFYREHNYGAAKNSTDLHNYVFETYDAFIFTEDDNIFSPCFLDYMNKCLDKYRDDENAIAISGYFEIENISIPIETNTIIKIIGSFNAWGYGAWEKKYKKLYASIRPNYRKFICNNKTYLSYFFRRKEQFKRLIFWLENRDLDRPCDITFSASNIINQKYMIYPSIPIVKNMGNDGTGINCSMIEDDYHSKRIITDKRNYEIIDNYTETEINTISEIFVKYLDTTYLSSKEEKQIKILLRFYYILGYNLTEKIRKIILQLKKISSIIKRGIKNVMR